MSKEAFKWDDDQIEELIDLVKENDSIYNTKHHNHRNRQVTEQIWAKIDMQLKKPPGICREQWQKLRICYRRNFSSDGPKARWRFYDKLNFLSDFLRFIDPENSLTNCIKRAEEKYFTPSSDGGFVEKTPDENDEKTPDDQIKSEDSISIYYLTDEEITLDNEEPDESDDDNEYHLVEYIQDDNEENTNSKHESNKISIKSIKKNIKKRNYQDRIDNEFTGTLENVSSSKDEENEVNHLLIDEPAKKKIKSYSPSKEFELASVESQNIITTNVKVEELPGTSILPPTKQPAQIDQQPENVVTCLCQNDTDTIFLRSILEDFKSMSKKNKCSFKIKVQKAIQDILYPDDD